MSWSRAAASAWGSAGGTVRAAPSSATSGKPPIALSTSGRPKASVKELGGTGRAHDWRLSGRIVGAEQFAHVPVWLAGGLTPANVGEAIRTARPHGVDVCSGLRTDGRLDEAKLKAFVAAVRGA